MRPNPDSTRVRRTAGAARYSAVVLLIGGAAYALCSCRSTPAASRIDRVLLISIDTCRADRLGCYGDSRAETPNIDAVAGDGCVFENVVSPVPLTLPAHSSMMTGTAPPVHGVRDNTDYRLRASAETLAEALKRGGFATAAVVSAFVLDSQFGLDQGFDEYHDQFLEEHKAGDVSERKGDEATDLALEWIAKHKDERFFLFLHYFDAHFPYEPPPPFDRRFASDPYAGEIAFVDACIGRVVGRLKELGLYDSTLIVITGDHGEMLGEHGESQHGYFVYQPAVKVPLIIKAPGRGAARVSDIVGLVDIAPTIAALVGVSDMPHGQGVDLSAHLEGTAAGGPDRAVYAESLTPAKYGANSLFALVTKRWKYIQTTQPELYDLAKDPGETTNMVTTKADVVGEMQKRLSEIVGEYDSAADAGSALPTGAAARRRLESLGYVASAVPREAFRFDPDREDPKDLIAYHEQRSRLSLLLAQDKYAEAVKTCDAMLRLRPDLPETYIARASIALKQHSFADAIPLLQRALEIEPDHAVANNMLGFILVSSRRPEEAIACFRRVLGRESASRTAPDLLAAHRGLAAALMAQGKRDEAIEQHRLALPLDPDQSRGQGVLGQALLAAGRMEEAIEHLRESLAIRPEQPDAHNTLGIALSRIGRKADALRQYREALRIRNDWLEPMNGAAWILATHPNENVRDSTEAVRLAERAVELMKKNQPPPRVAVTVLDTLAAAYASAGRFDRATAVAEEAVSTAAAAGLAVDAIRARLALYRQGAPFVAGG